MIGRSLLALFAITAVCSIQTSADEFANRVFSVTKEGNVASYTTLIDAHCHVVPSTAKSFELRSDILNKLQPGYRVEVMSFMDYVQMMRGRGAPIDRVRYTVEPSHIVIVRGKVAGVTGGDYVALNPILRVDDGWRVLDGDCINRAG